MLFQVGCRPPKAAANRYCQRQPQQGPHDVKSLAKQLVRKGASVLRASQRVRQATAKIDACVGRACGTTDLVEEIQTKRHNTSIG
jgi:hypothetical protein